MAKSSSSLEMLSTLKFCMFLGHFLFMGGIGLGDQRFLLVLSFYFKDILYVSKSGFPFLTSKSEIRSLPKDGFPSDIFSLTQCTPCPTDTPFPPLSLTLWSDYKSQSTLPKNCGRKSMAYLALLFTYYLVQIISLWLNLSLSLKKKTILKLWKAGKG